MKRYSSFIFIVALFIIFSGCPSRAWYEGYREAERQNCYKIESPTERQECLDRVNETSYDQYKKDREKSQKQ